MVTKRNSKPAGKSGKAVRRSTTKSKVAKRVAGRKATKVAKGVKNSGHAKVAKAGTRAATRKSHPNAKATPRPGAKSNATTKKQASPVAQKATSRPASVKTAAKAVAAARASAAKRRPPSYIPRSRFSDDWMPGGSVELPPQPNPAAHTPTRKPPKPRAPKPKAISHEQAVANLKALLESRKRKDRGGNDGASASKRA
ncbi:MAG: hypothetical protein ACREPU_08075 [Rhodanobacteraceae bacterium]